MRYWLQDYERAGIRAWTRAIDFDPTAETSCLIKKAIYLSVGASCVSYSNILVPYRYWYHLVTWAFASPG